MTSVITPTGVAPSHVAPTAAITVEPEAPAGRASTWPRWAVRAGVLGVGVLVGLLAPSLGVVLLIAVVVLMAIGLNLWSEERAREKKLVVNPATLVIASALAGIAALAEVIGLLFALIAFVGLIVLFFVLGGDLS
jgi:uncharacterized iron-regulated membrane protein